MHKRPFNNSGANVSEVGLGCWQLGGNEWGDISDDTALATLQAAYDAGVTFFDTADIYGLGRSETLIGQFLRERVKRDDIFIASKLGRRYGYPDGYSYEQFASNTEDSLKRLGIETLDLTQLHCIPMRWMQRDEPWEWLARLQQQGKIKAFGASVESMDEALVCLEKPGLASLQIIFNIFRQKPIDVLFEKAKAKNVALIIRLPIASGLLSGKMTKGQTFAAKDHRQFNRDGQAFNVGETFAGLPFELGVDLADELKQYVPAGMTMAQFALRWILDHDAVTTVIPGASRPQQAADNAAASDLPPLGDELHARLRTFYRDKVAAHIRGPY